MAESVNLYTSGVSGATTRRLPQEVPHGTGIATQHRFGSLLATDGKPHPLQDTLLAVTLVLGLTAFITGFFHSLHLLSSWTGLVGILIGAYGQWISRRRGSASA